jgi:hypothetical protein
LWNLTEPWWPEVAKVQSFLRNRTGEITMYIGIHVRRGDMLKAQTYRLPDFAYYERAMACYRRMYNFLTKFLVASDDKQWCQKNFIS